MKWLVATLVLAIASTAAAQSVTVFSSNATKALIEELGPAFEKATGQKSPISVPSTRSKAR